MSNNFQLLNAAVAGFLEGTNSALLTDPDAADYAPQVNAAVVFATVLDGLIATDGTLVTPTTAVTVAKVGLMRAICAGVWAGRNARSVTAGDYTTTATAIKALYTQAVAALVAS